MTNEEMKKKIVDIALHAEWMDMFGDHNSIGKYAANAIADALIAAGIGDVSEYKEKLKLHRVFVRKDGGDIKVLYGNNEVDEIVKERNEYKHRAGKAESALMNAVKVIVDACEANPNYAYFYNKFLQQAEKELQEEERKDENN